LADDGEIAGNRRRGYAKPNDLPDVTVLEITGYAERPAARPLTKFEQRGIDRGHGVRDLVFTKRS